MRVFAWQKEEGWDSAPELPFLASTFSLYKPLFLHQYWGPCLPLLTDVE